MTDKKLVIFDMDGTLVDSSLTIANAINYVREALYLPKLSKEDIIQNINNHNINPARYFYNAQHFLPEHERLFSSYYTKNHTKELSLYDGIHELLAELRNVGKKIAIATNAYRKSALESLEHLEIIDYFDSVVCFDDVSHGKPSAEMLLKIMTRAQCKPHESVFVGDGQRDKIAATRANIDYIMVNWGFSDYTEGAIGDVALLREKLIGAYG